MAFFLHFFDYVFQLLLIVPRSLILLDNGVQGVPHVMRDRGVDQREVRIILLQLTVKNDMGLINQLDHEVLLRHIFLYLEVLVSLLTWVHFTLRDSLEDNKVQGFLAD